MEYVECSEPELVITDNSRVAHGETLAKEIKKHFGISVVALPGSRTLESIARRARNPQFERFEKP